MNCLLLDKRTLYIANIYVVASNAGPSIFPFFLGGRLAGHRYPPRTPNYPYDPSALAGGCHSDRPAKHWLWPTPNRNRARMQMAAPRATICLIPSYEPSAVAGRTRPMSAPPHFYKKAGFPCPWLTFWQNVLLNTPKTPLSDTSLVAGSSVASRLVYSLAVTQVTLCVSGDP